MNVVVPKLETAREVCEQSVKLEKQQETVYMAAANEVLESAKTINDTVLRAELENYPQKMKEPEIFHRSDGSDRDRSGSAHLGHKS